MIRSLFSMVVGSGEPILPGILLLAACSGGQQEKQTGPGRAQELGRTLKAHYQQCQWKEADTLLRQLLARDPATAAEAISVVLRDTTIEGRNGIVQEVERSGIKAFGSMLTAYLDDPDDDVRLSIGHALGSFGDPATIPALEKRLGIEPNGHVREELRLALARLGLPYLKYYLDGLADRNPERRRWCMIALGELQDKRAVPSLVRVLESKHTWDPRNATDTLTRITGVVNVDWKSMVVRPDGTTQKQGMTRPILEFREDCLEWMKKHKEEIQRPIEEPSENWAYTPEPFLPGVNVSFAMTAGEVKKLYDHAKVECLYSPERRWEQNGQDHHEIEGVTAKQSLWEELNGRLVDVTYSFEDRRLSEISFRFLRPLEDSLRVVKGPWGLVEKGRGTWEGIGGNIKLQLGAGNVEWQGLSVWLNFQN